MRSLFWRILVWLFSTALITSVGFAIVTRLFSGEAMQYGPLPARVVQFFAEDALSALRSGGPDGLARYFDRLENITGIRASLIGGDGRDVISGEDQSQRLERLRRSNFFVTVYRGSLVAGRRTLDQSHFLLLRMSPMLAPLPVFLPQHLWVLGSAMLLSYWLARSLTDPLRQLQLAADRFGRGNLATRAPQNRKDEVGRLAETFNNMASRIERLVDSQRQLLLDVSHELRSPLTRLTVAVELARGIPNPARELDVIEQQAERLNTLVGTLLQVSRAEQSSLQLSRIDLSELVGSVADSCRVETASCILNVSTAPEWIEADRELLHRAIENVLRNAIRYAPPGSTVDIVQKAGVIRVRDRGPGVPPEALGNLFDAFYRVEGQHGAGFGLGLSIAQRAVELHGGRISAQNANPGLEVVLDLSQALK